MPEAIQTSLLREDGALVVAGAPFCCFELKGSPRGKGAMRFRVAWSNGKPYCHGYVDSETANYMQVLGWAAKVAMQGRPPTTNPVAVLIHVYMPIPVSWSERDQNHARAGAIRPTGKPDWDNFGKMLDALKGKRSRDGKESPGIVWKDDAQVVDGRVIKLYSDHPALRVEVREFVAPGGDNGR